MTEKQVNKFIVLAKQSHRMIHINHEDFPEFVKRFNDHKISSDMLNSCAKAGRLFKRRGR